MTIGTLLQKVQALDTDDVAERSLDELSDSMVALQRDQLLQGETSTGSDMEDTPGGHYKWESYAEEKYSKNDRAGYGNPDLYKTGAFHRAIVANVVNGSIIIESTDSKADGLESKYGADAIFGLNPKSKAKLMIELRPVFIEKVKKALYG